MLPRLVSLFVVLIALPLAAASRPYHLELEAYPSAPFPYLGRFGTVTLHVYPAGVRAETIWLNGFSRNATNTITVMNPYGRMYTNLPLADIGSVLQKLGGSKVTSDVPLRAPDVGGKVRGVDAYRHRLMYGPEAWIDIWTTTALGDNPQLRAITIEVLRGISPGTATAMRSIPGTPLYVELNFRRFKKLPLVRMKSLIWDASGEAEALKVGAVYFKAPLLDELWK